MRKRKVLNGYLSEAEQAAALCVSVRTLRKWRAEGTGPRFAKVGRRVFYPIDADTAWVKANEHVPVRTERAA